MAAAECFPRQEAGQGAYAGADHTVARLQGAIDALD